MGSSVVQYGCACNVIISTLTHPTPPPPAEDLSPLDMSTSDLYSSILDVCRVECEAVALSAVFKGWLHASTTDQEDVHIELPPATSTCTALTETHTHASVHMCVCTYTYLWFIPFINYYFYYKCAIILYTVLLYALHLASPESFHRCTLEHMCVRI